MSKFSVVLAILISSAGAAYYAYGYAKASYYEVGVNDGTIDEQYRVFKQIAKAAGPLPLCTPAQMRVGAVMVAVKAEAILAIKNEKQQILLCETP